MKKIIIILSLILTVSDFMSQNLVQNPSFEEYWSLPYPYNPYTIDTFFVKNWFLPNYSSPDFLTARSSFESYKVPYNDCGFHPAHDGESYIGIYPLSWYGYSEHITGTLIDSLKEGGKYQISLYIRKAGVGVFFNFNTFAILFSKDKYPFFRLSVGIEESMISNNYSAFFRSRTSIIDTSWNEIVATYVAKGGEKYFTIGFLFEDLDEFNWFKQKSEEFIRLSSRKNKNRYSYNKYMKFIKRNQKILTINEKYDKEKNVFGGKHSAYYFIDDVKIIEIEND